MNKDLKDCNISLLYEDIQNTTKLKFKEIVKSAVQKASFRKLQEEKNKLSKGKDMKYEEPKTQQYLMPGNCLNIQDMRRILQIRIRDSPVKSNYQTAFTDTSCPALGCKEKETQKHLFESSCWIRKEDLTSVHSNAVRYSDIFESSVQKQFEVMSIIFERLKARNQILYSDRPLDPR